MSDDSPSQKWAVCACNTCSGHLEFDPAYAGTTIKCPHCGMDTVLFIPQVQLGSAPPSGKPRRTAAWLAAIAIALAAVCLATILIWEHQSKNSRAPFGALQVQAAKGDPKAEVALGWLYYTNGGDMATNWSEAAKWWSKAAEQGDAEAQFHLGGLYHDGEGVAKDAAKAFQWFFKSAQQGYALAQYQVALAYEDGSGVAQEKAEAAKWYTNAFQSCTKASEQGDKEAQRSLGYMYSAGQGVEEDLTKAFQWFFKSAEQGDAWAQHSLARAYDQGWGVAQDKGEAAKWHTNALQTWTKAAEQGDVAAQLHLGSVYKDDFFAGLDGVQQDARQAVKWYTKAAERGVAEAQYSLGIAYDEGEGVEKDARQAVKWFTKAADQGDEHAQWWLGFAYEKGEGVQKDAREAVKWYIRAAEQGDYSARSKLTDTLDWADQSAQQLVIGWSRKPAQQGDTDAQSILGRAYYHGLGVAQDKAEGVKWYTEAARSNEFKQLPAQLMLGYIYQAGDGVARDPQAAFKWFLAAERCITNYQARWNSEYLGAGDKTAQNFQSLLGEPQYEVAKAYEFGLGVLQDKQEAFNWFLKAAYNGQWRAQLSLGGIYFKAELASAEDRIEAHKWFSLAAKQGTATGLEAQIAASATTRCLDVLEKSMTAQELAEAGRRARAVLGGEPPPSKTLPRPAEAPVKLTSGQERPEFEVVSLTARVTERNDSWWRFAYRLTLRNNGSSTEGKSFEIQFLDNDGYVIDTTIARRQMIKPGASETITGDALVRVPGASRVTKYKAVPW